MFISHPSQNPHKYRNPGEHQVPFENHRIECSDGVFIHSWLMLREEGEQQRKRPTIIFFHGNAGNIGLRIPNCLQMLQYLNVNVLAVEYRGYGDSDSITPNEEGIKLDAEAALRFVTKHPRLDDSTIFVFGRSLGGAVAFHMAGYAEEQGLPLAGVIVENTFTSIAAMVDHLMPYVAPLKALVLRIGWNSLNIVPTLRTPILFVAGARDQLVPHHHMITLHKSASRSRLNKIHIVQDGTHNETWMQGGQEYWDAIRSFLAQAVDKSASASTPEMVTSSVHSSQTDATISSNATSIPIMPSGLFGIAGESMRTTSSGPETQNKKEL